MKKLFIIFALSLSLTACQTTDTTYSSTEESSVTPSAFAHFTDIPVPHSAAMNLNKTVILGSGEHWTGKLAFNTPLKTSETFDFFVQEMPKLGWKETATVRANVSFLTYNRDGREIIIQIYGDSDQSSVDLMVSPQKRDEQ